jgi:two-component system chemotaxis sensor kinase CheA
MQIEMVRVSADSLDGLLRSSGQIAAEAPRQNRITRELGAISRRMQELQGEVDRIQGAQASRLAPLSARIRSVANELREIAAEQSQSAWTLLRSAERLQEDAEAARIVRAESLIVGFRKMVRDLAHDQGKKVQFRVTGSEIRADRAILQALKDPLMHLLRNAVSHGIETPRQRRAKDKPDEGTIALDIALERGRLILTVEDDGNGVDVETVVRAAVDKGLIDQEEVSRRSPEELAKLIFQPGFSTALGLTDLSGRGFGLSVVQETVRHLQGDLDLGRIRSGMRVILSVPLSASARHLLLVSCQEQTFGIPTHAIENVNRIRIGDLAREQGKPMMRITGRQVPVFALSSLLGLSNQDSREASDALRVVALKSGERRAAVIVDAFLGERNALLQELGLPVLPRYVSGGVVGDDGAPLVVLNPATLIDLCFEQRAPVFSGSSPPAKEVSPRILIVDDSITTRSLERSILDAHGFRTSVAVNGVQALEILRSEGADLVLTDLEMPELDGFGLITAIRSDKKLKNIPVIVVSSRGGVADEKQGLLLGADAYVIKSKFDQVELIQTIRRAL